MGLRHRAMLADLITNGCRIGALCRLRTGDLRTHEEGRLFRFREKNGREREIPVRNDLEEWIEAYMGGAGIAEDPTTAPLWRSALRGGSVTLRRVIEGAVRTIFKHRLAADGIPDNLTPNYFRFMIVTAVLSQNVPVEEVQHLVGCYPPSTIQLSDRWRRRVTRSIVECIPF